ncbi:hypothetical protein H0G86_009058 [Trichoderma simmonsii]|uniref:Uncharacterized protein n=1 Tax=Trichoderma simmonsii TaxID=1491479 RepID=A0A8G0LGT1_9HYPO|nr:hypothetical protein H0G86_009058 [Trichoderma simmonsii]
MGPFVVALPPQRGQSVFTSACTGRVLGNANSSLQLTQDTSRSLEPEGLTGPFPPTYYLRIPASILCPPFHLLSFQALFFSSLTTFIITDLLLWLPDPNQPAA